MPTNAVVRCWAALKNNRRSTSSCLRAARFVVVTVVAHSATTKTIFRQETTDKTEYLYGTTPLSGN